MERVLPAEWHEQRMVQLTWPHEDSDWDYVIDDVRLCFKNIAREVAARQPLLIVARDAEEVRIQIATEVNMDNVRIVEIDSNDTWARDHGGITIVKEGKPVVLDFQFNGWGLKFASDKDNLIIQRLDEMGVLGAPRRNCRNFVLEGGSIESDGKGTVMTTAECLLSPNRNATMNREDIEEVLKSELGAKRVLWLENGYLSGDDTDSHIDTLARFASEDTIVYVKCDDECDEHYEALKAMERELQQFTTADGCSYRLVAVPMAEPMFEDGLRLPATYANFLIINGAVLMPTYGSKLDEVAMQQLQKAFPDREIVGVDCSVLVRQHG